MNEIDERVDRHYGWSGLPERIARLRAIERTWDPDNRFRHNANILPA